MEVDLQGSNLVSPQQLLKYLRICMGLSEYEARIYEFLVNEGPSTARKISLRCGVPRTKVYCVLRRLIEQNIITEAPMKPRLFVALPPNEVLKPFIELQEKIVERLRKIFLDLQRRYEESMSLKMIREEFWILSGEESFTKVLDLLLSAEGMVEIFSPWKLFLQTYRFLMDALNCLLEKGINVRLYFPYDSNIDERVCHNMGLQYKLIRGLPPLLMILVDDKCIALYSIKNENNISSEGEWIIIHDKKLLNFFRRILSFFKERHPSPKSNASEEYQKLLL